MAMEGSRSVATALVQALVTVKDAFYCKTRVQRGYKMFQITFDLVLQGCERQNWTFL